MPMRLSITAGRAAGILLSASLLAAGCEPSRSNVTADTTSLAEVLHGRSLDGSGNNREHPSWGQAGQPYPRGAAAASYADGVGAPVTGPEPRYVSNRIYNDLAQNVFSASGISHWGFVWGQFVDHTIGLAESSEETADIAFDPSDPLERFVDDLGSISFNRDAYADGTGVDSPRESVNTVSSYIDAWNVYGGSVERLEWLRAGPIDGDLSNNDPHLLLSADGNLPTQADRPDDPAPEMAYMGRLQLDPSAAAIAGDVRANENIGLLAVQTLFAREHNRIVDALPDSLPNEARFEIARRVVGAEEQWITYHEFLPAMGVDLPAYAGYDPTVDASLSTEFATVGYRAHSFIHGELEPESTVDDLSVAERDALEAAGVEVAVDGDDVELTVPLGVAFGNPGLLSQIGEDAVLRGLSGEREYANDEMIDDQLRSVLFQVPGPDTADPAACLDGPTLPDCYHGVLDLGAIDMARSADHGIPGYNDLREAYGLARVERFTDITGEATQSLPAGTGIDDPASIDFVDLRDDDGNRVAALDADAVAVHAERATTLAARLAEIYGDVDHLDAFTGMMSEAHVAGTELGPLQLAMWTRQFAALRDGDRFYFANDSVLDGIAAKFGISYKRSLAEVIASNTSGEAGPADVFHVDGFRVEPGTTTNPTAPSPSPSVPLPAAPGSPPATAPEPPPRAHPRGGDRPGGPPPRRARGGH